MSEFSDKQIAEVEDQYLDQQIGDRETAQSRAANRALYTVTDGGHKVHVWKLLRAHELICIVCGIRRRVEWPYDPDERPRIR